MQLVCGGCKGVGGSGDSPPGWGGGWLAGSGGGGSEVGGTDWSSSSLSFSSALSKMLASRSMVKVVWETSELIEGVERGKCCGTGGVSW